MKEVKLTDSEGNAPAEESQLVNAVAQQPDISQAPLVLVHEEPKEIVDNEENVLEENHRVALPGAKDFKVTALWSWLCFFRCSFL